MLNHIIGYDASDKIPQILSSEAEILTYPFYPHCVPQEFLTKKYSIPFSYPNPTAKTPWSSCFPHYLVVITPEV